MRYSLIDFLRNTQVISYYKKMRQKQYSPDELEELQHNKLASFLLLLRMHNPFYSKLLRGTEESRIRTFPEDVLYSLPLTDKLFITHNMNNFFSPIQGRKYQAKRTGGSTGQPFHYYIDLKAISEIWAYILLCWNKYTNYKPGESYLTVAGSSLYSVGQQFKAKIYQILQNNYFIPGDVISKEMIINKKKIKKAHLLYGYPSSILTLLEMNPSLFDHHQLRAVFSTSEQLTPNIRRFLKETLKIPIYDMYGANDGGLISCECEAHCGLHYDSLNCYVEEYINEFGQSELLLTNLNSLSLPFVRYRVGDVAILGDFGSCDCGNPFPMIHDLQGRTRDLIRLQNGQTIHGSMFNKILFSFPQVRRYQIIQAENYNVSIKLEIDDFELWYVSEWKKNIEKKFSDLLKDTPFSIEELITNPIKNSKYKLIESYVR